MAGVGPCGSGRRAGACRATCWLAPRLALCTPHLYSAPQPQPPLSHPPTLPPVPPTPERLCRLLYPALCLSTACSLPSAHAQHAWPAEHAWLDSCLHTHKHAAYACGTRPLHCPPTCPLPPPARAKQAMNVQSCPSPCRPPPAPLRIALPRACLHPSLRCPSNLCRSHLFVVADRSNWGPPQWRQGAPASPSTPPACLSFLPEREEIPCCSPLLPTPPLKHLSPGTVHFPPPVPYPAPSAASCPLARSPLLLLRAPQCYPSHTTLDPALCPARPVRPRCRHCSGSRRGRPPNASAAGAAAGDFRPSQKALLASFFFPLTPTIQRLCLSKRDVLE